MYNMFTAMTVKLNMYRNKWFISFSKQKKIF